MKWWHGASALPAFVLLGCESAPLAPDRDIGHVAVTLDLAGMQVAIAVVEVSASDMPVPLVFNLPLLAGTASGSLDVPCGPARSFTARAFDYDGVETHRAHATADVCSGGGVEPLRLRMLAVDNSTPASAMPAQVILTPDSASLSIGSQLRLTATPVNAAGEPLNATVSWAVTDAAVANVSASGLVSARSVGEVNVIAMASGTAAVARIRVLAQ